MKCDRFLKTKVIDNADFTKRLALNDSESLWPTRPVIVWYISRKHAVRSLLITEMDCKFQLKKVGPSGICLFTMGAMASKRATWWSLDEPDAHAPGY